MSQNKKQDLKSAANTLFSKKGYKATGISEIAKQAGVAVGSFYNYYDSKEAIFLDIYIDENNRVRQKMMKEIDWQGGPVQLVSQIFVQSHNLIASNKILLEWYNPSISDYLHSYFGSKKGKDHNVFHQFLIETFRQYMVEEGFTQAKIQDILNVYQLFYYMDTHITKQDFPEINKTIETLATYFVKGIFK